MPDLAIHPSSLIRRAAALHADREAIVWQDERLTYGGLAARTDALAAALGEAGLVPGARVALLGRNNLGYAVGLLALARRGFSAVPLNWRLGAQALTATAAKYAPDGLLYTRDFAATADALRAALPSIRAAVCVDAPDTDLPTPAAAATWVAASARPPRRDDVFAYISTGGTEGVPKGVIVTNAMLEACVMTMLAADPVSADDVTLVLPQMFHNPHLYVVGPLLVGGKLVVPDMPSFDAELVLRTIEAEGVTRFLGVATMMNYLLDAQDRIGADLHTLRTISYGGAPFSPRLIERLLDVFGCDLMQLYGQTETSVLVSTLRPEDHRAALADPALRHRLESAGRPAPLVEARVVDDRGRDVPHDRAAVGEIVVRAPSVMAAYFDDPERTAEKLRDGWCHTGDLATWDGDGYLYIVDRRNDLIISGGENVFPSAVEAVIRELDAVDDVVVIGVPDEVWGQVVTAVVLPRAGQQVSADQVSALCNERLARYMRPRVVHVVDELPRNASGKVLRGEVKQRYVAPSSTSSNGMSSPTVTSASSARPQLPQ
jgi:acyl-CoA synthetase (AMP-forming)/AMP-acid ligase II